MTAPPETVRFVLVETRSPGNLGSTARALKNLGFHDLRLVRPLADPGDAEARRLAVHAVDVLEGARPFEDLDAALADSAVVLATSGLSGRARVPDWRLDDLRPHLAGWQRQGPLSIVFGREDRGLTDDELDRATHLVHLPSAEAYPSFNLAQAVLLVAYELHRAGADAPGDPHAGRPRSSHADREAMYAHWAEAAGAIGFVRPETQLSIARQFRRLLGRAELRRDEVVLLRGLARQVLWAAAQAGLVDDREEP